jgi:hypothetical protein
MPRRYQNKPTAESKPCEVCGTPIYRNMNRSRAYFAVRRVCSTKCYGKLKQGKARPDYQTALNTRAWQGGPSKTCPHCRCFDGTTPLVTIDGKRETWCPKCVREFPRNIREILHHEAAKITK